MNNYSDDWDMQCQCGQNDFGNDMKCWCCGTGSYVEGPVRSTVHTARKNHGNGIKPGDRYRRTVTMGHYPGGGFTMTVNKLKVS